MPELPEVRTTSKFINEDIQNQIILDCNFLIPKMIKNWSIDDVKEKLIGLKVIEVTNKSKFIIFNFEKDISLISHMRMEGKYRFEKNLDLKKHDHAWFKFKHGYLIYNDTRKFGTFEIYKTSNLKNNISLKKLGPYPDINILNDILIKLSRKRIAIKSSLLDQSIVSGIGNIYVDEILWASKINPLTKSSDIKRKDLLLILKNADRILANATKENGSSIKTYLAYNQVKGNYQNFLEVHTKENKPCSRCSTKILKMKVNGRGTYYCPKCQIN